MHDLETSLRKCLHVSVCCTVTMTPMHAAVDGVVAVSVSDLRQ
jgi:hypothetical protein